MSLKFDSVMVTGGCGFIGTHVVDELARRGVDVTVLDNLSRKPVALPDANKVRFIESDIRDIDAVSRAMRGVEAVVHLAAVKSVPDSARDPTTTFEVNVIGTRNVLEACAKAGVRSVVVASSCAVYGEAVYLPQDESHPTRPCSVYGWSKLLSEDVCGLYSDRLGVTVLRLFNVYGPTSNAWGENAVIPQLISRLRAGKPPVIYGDGRQFRDFVHVSDVTNAIVLALQHAESLGRNVFNIGTGITTTIAKLASLVAELMGARSVRPVMKRRRRGDIIMSQADIRKAKHELGFSPTVCLRAGIEDLAQRGKT
jgi:UDP-glucose 4-epimerase